MTERDAPEVGAWKGISIVGSTAVGKSALAMELATGGKDATEIVSVDSMQVYRGMDIGTATPGPADQAAVRHHLIDIADPCDEVSVAWFQQKAAEALSSLSRRRVLPVLVGGTGLYHRAVIDELEIPGQYPDVRRELEPLDTTELYSRLREADPVAAGRIESANRRRTIRALEVCLGSGRPFSSFGEGLETYRPSGYLLIGIRLPRDELDRRISSRLRTQIDDGFLDEVSTLNAAPRPMSTTAAQALGYRELASHLVGDIDLADATAAIQHRTRRFAVRQERWFRRDPRIHWIDGDAGPGELAEAVWEKFESGRP